MRGTPKKLGRSQRARINAILNESRLTVLHDGRANAAQTGVSEPVWLVNTTDHSWRSLTIESQSLSNLDGSLRYVSAVPSQRVFCVLFRGCPLGRVTRSASAKFQHN